MDVVRLLATESPTLDSYGPIGIVAGGMLIALGVLARWLLGQVNSSVIRERDRADKAEVQVAEQNAFLRTDVVPVLVQNRDALIATTNALGRLADIVGRLDSPPRDGR